MTLGPMAFRKFGGIYDSADAEAGSAIRPARRRPHRGVSRAGKAVAVAAAAIAVAVSAESASATMPERTHVLMYRLHDPPGPGWYACILWSDYTTSCNFYYW